MKWSWKIGTFAGIAVYIHTTFLLLLGWIAFSHWMQYQSLIPALTGVLLGFVPAIRSVEGPRKRISTSSIKLFGRNVGVVSGLWTLIPS